MGNAQSYLKNTSMFISELCGSTIDVLTARPKVKCTEGPQKSHVKVQTKICISISRNHTMKVLLGEIPFLLSTIIHLAKVSVCSSPLLSSQSPSIFTACMIPKGRSSALFPGISSERRVTLPRIGLGLPRRSTAPCDTTQKVPDDASA